MHRSTLILGAQDRCAVPARARHGSGGRWRHRRSIVRNEDVISLAGVSENEFAAIRDRQLAEIERRRKTYLGDRPHPELAAHTVIVVDDGIATGATTRAALEAVRLRKPSKLVLAVPVAPTDTLTEAGR